MIYSPIPIVKFQPNGCCSECENDMRHVWEHSNYPGMTLCSFCLDDFGAAVPASVTYLKTAYDVWESAAKKQGRELVARVY